MKKKAFFAAAYNCEAPLSGGRVPSRGVTSVVIIEHQTRLSRNGTAGHRVLHAGNSFVSVPGHGGIASCEIRC
jgi:hypothetical protein